MKAPTKLETDLANTIIKLVGIIAFLMIVIFGLVLWLLSDHGPQPVYYF